MQRRTILTVFTTLSVFLTLSAGLTAAFASDDIIIDEPIRDDVELDHNVSYIYIKAVGRAGSTAENTLVTETSTSVSLGSIVVEPGAEVNDITLIFESDNNILVSN